VNATEQRFNSHRTYLRHRFGKPVLKISLQGGFSCPNRDGTLSLTGCSFCDNASFSPAARINNESPLTQLHNAITRTHHRFERFVVYLQPFSNTYAPVSRLREVYEPLIAAPGVVGLAIGTRPDCFTDETFDYLADLSRRIYLSVELGLQSVSDATLARNNRGHRVDDFERCAARLARLGIETTAHLIFLLPGDGPESAVAAARFLNRQPVAGVKVHQLMIIKGTQVEQWYAAGEVVPLTLEAYARLVADFIAALRPDMLIHRLVADSRPEHGLVAPLWSMEKHAALAVINAELSARDIRQGCRC
jgi:radical SAM protein (TIGR01212 family)